MTNEVNPETITETGGAVEEVELPRGRRKYKKRKHKYKDETFPHSHRFTKKGHEGVLANRENIDKFYNGLITALEFLDNFQLYDIPERPNVEKRIYQKRFL